jgi:hypothetical protein
MLEDAVLVRDSGAPRTSASTGSSSDPSKYEKVPVAVRKRFEVLQRAALVLLVLLALGMIAGDGWALRYGKGSGSGGGRGGPVGAAGARVRGVRVAEGGALALAGPPVAPEEAKEEDAWAGAAEEKEEGGAAPRVPGAGARDGPAKAAEEDGPVHVKDMLASNKEEGAAAAEAAAAAAAAAAAPAKAKAARKAAAAKAAGAPVSRPIEGPVSWALLNAQSCDGYFGNGYSEVAVLVPSSDEDSVPGPLLECRRHPATTAAFCVARNAIMYPERIRMSRGGEPLESVMGRTEEEEVPRFSDGAFELVGGAQVEYEGLPIAADAVQAPSIDGEKVDGGTIMSGLEHADRHKAEFVKTTRVLAGASGRACVTRVSEPVLAVTRMEYANLFHTSTDWYNVWSVARLLGLEATEEYAVPIAQLTPDSLVSPYGRGKGEPKIPAHVLFLDGHNAGPMDEGWLGLFLSVTYAKHFAGPTCFDNIIYAPFG